VSRLSPEARSLPSPGSAADRGAAASAWTRRTAARLSTVWLPILLVPTAIVVGLLAEGSLVPAPCRTNASCYDEVEVWVLGNALVGWSTIAAGLVAWFRRPGTPGGRLLTAAGFAWFLGGTHSSFRQEGQRGNSSMSRRIAALVPVGPVANCLSGAPRPAARASRFGASLGREERRRMERPPVAALPPAGEWAGRSGAQSGAGGRW
jgi:hypothetical protein